MSVGAKGMQRMDKGEFQRIAPRYADGEASEAEIRAVQDALLTDFLAQRQVELLERESLFMARSFARPAEDISSIVIRVRARNPYRKVYVSPVIALAVQATVMMIVALAMIKLASELTPPPLFVDDRSGVVTLEQRELSAADTNVPFNRLLACGPRSQARFLVGNTDSVRMNENTSLRFGLPRPGARHVVNLEHGEVWARFIDSEAHFAMTFVAIEDFELTGERAEINVAAGVSACGPLLPRGAPQMPVELMIRVIEGRIEARRGTEHLTLTPGRAWVLAGGASLPTVVADEDIVHYPVLRLDEHQRFKHRWNWLSVSRFPLAREAVTYDIWKRLVTAADTATQKKAVLSARDGAGEMTGLRRSARSNVRTAQRWVEKNPAAEGTPARDALLQTAPEVVVQKAQVLEEQDPRLLHAFSSAIVRILDGWEARDPQYLPLFSSNDVTGILKVLAGGETDGNTLLARTWGAQRGISSAEENERGAVEACLKARQELEALLQSQLRDPDGKRSAELDATIDRLSKELLRLNALQQNIDLLRLQLQPRESQIEALNAEITPKEQELTARTGELEGVKSSLAENKFSDAALAAAIQAIETWTAAETARTTARDQWKGTLDDKRAAMEGAARMVGQYGADLSGKRARRDEIDVEIVPLLADMATARVAVQDSDKALLAAQEALNALAEDARAGSPQEQTLRTAQAARADAQTVLTGKEGALATAMNALATVGKAVSDLEEMVRKGELAHANLKTETTTAEGAYDNAVRDLEKAKSERVQAEQIRDFQISEKNKREELTRKRDTLQTQVEELKGPLTNLKKERQRIVDEIQPKRTELESLVQEQAGRTEVQKKIETARSELGQIEAIEEQIRRARGHAVEEQDKLLAAIRLTADRHAGLGNLLAASVTGMPESLQQAQARRAEANELAKQAASNAALHDSLLETVLVAGGVEEQQLRAFIETLRQSNAAEIDRLRERRLAYAYLRGLAERHEADALALNDVKAQEFNVVRKTLAGFDEGFRESPESVRGFLRACIAQDIPDVLAAEKTAPLVDALLKEQWDLFQWLPEMTSELALRADPAKRQQDARRSYLPILRSDIADVRLRGIDGDWRDRYDKILPEPVRNALRGDTLSSGASGDGS